VELSAAEGRITVNAGRAKFTLATLPRDDFPMIAEGELPTTFELPAETLKQIIDKTRFAISTEETRYYLNGIFLHVADEAAPVLKAAATDGHRLARVTVPRPDGAESMPDVIIPRKCIAELRKLLDEVDGSVGVSLSASKIRFDMGQAILTSKLIDGTFPDYQRVIPTGNDKVLEVDARNNSAKNIYIQSATLNGKPWTRPWFSHADIANGATLVLTMGPEPNKAWGTGPHDAPPSMTARGETHED
jgi:DNA polymerase-3 subunit beta